MKESQLEKIESPRLDKSVKMNDFKQQLKINLKGIEVLNQMYFE